MVIVPVRVIMSSGVACVLTSLVACGRSLGDLQRRLGCFRARGAEQIRGEPGGNRRCHPGDGAEHGHDRVGQRVGQADAVDPGFRRRDEERDGGARRRSLLAQPERCWQDAAGAQGYGRADDRSPEHGLDLSSPDQPGQQPARHEDPEHPGEQEAEEEEDRSLFQDFPGLPKDAEQIADHNGPLFGAAWGRWSGPDRLVPDSEVRITSRRTLMRTSESKGH